MATIPLYNSDGKQIGELPLPDAIFGVEFNESLVHQAIVTEEANQRLGTAQTKERGDVRGGTVGGDLYLVGGGDPVLSSSWWHGSNPAYAPFNTTSIDELVQKVKAAGVTKVDGDVVGDATRYDEPSKVITEAGYVIVGTWTDSFDRAKAKANIEDVMIKHPKLALMTGLFEYNSTLAVEVLKQTGKLGKVQLAAFDEGADVITAIKEGTVLGTVVQDPYGYGFESVRMGLRGIPACSEDVMVARDILLAEVTGAKYHVAHISARHSVEMVRYAKARGLNVTTEVCPHHFTLADSDILPFDSNYKMKPPLRSCFDVEAVTEGLINGAIEVIATDHAPHPGSEKMQEFERCPFGITGLETAIGLSLEQLVHKGRVSLMRMIEMFTVNPDRILNLGKGRLTIGGEADITIFDTDRAWTFDINKSHSKSRNTPFKGWRLRGRVLLTLVAGKVVHSA